MLGNGGVGGGHHLVELVEDSFGFFAFGQLLGGRGVQLHIVQHQGDQLRELHPSAHIFSVEGVIGGGAGHSQHADALFAVHNGKIGHGRQLRPFVQHPPPRPREIIIHKGGLVGIKSPPCDKCFAPTHPIAHQKVLVAGVRPHDQLVPIE